MRSTEQIEEIETGKKPEKSMDANFLKAGPRTVGELTLQPYSPSRRVASQAMGLHFAYVDDAGKERFERTSLYPGQLRDVAIVTWLCAKATEDEVDGAGIEPATATKKAIEWASQQGLLDIKNDIFWKANSAFWDIMDEIANARFKPEKKTSASTPAKK